MSSTPREFFDGVSAPECAAAVLRSEIASHRSVIPTRPLKVLPVRVATSRRIARDLIHTLVICSGRGREWRPVNSSRTVGRQVIAKTNLNNCFEVAWECTVDRADPPFTRPTGGAVSSAAAPSPPPHSVVMYARWTNRRSEAQRGAVVMIKTRTK